MLFYTLLTISQKTSLTSFHFLILKQFWLSVRWEIPHQSILPLQNFMILDFSSISQMQCISKAVGRSDSSKNYPRTEPQTIRLGPQLLSMIFRLSFMEAILEQLKMNKCFCFIFIHERCFFMQGKITLFFWLLFSFAGKLTLFFDFNHLYKMSVYKHVFFCVYYVERTNVL